MSDLFLDNIASDLGIKRFENYLNPTMYTCYSIYSAAILWIKTATQDSIPGKTIGSKDHIVKVCGDFLSRVLEDKSDEIKKYFIPKRNNNTAATGLINAMLRIGELIETLEPGTNKPRISLPIANRLKLTDSYSIFTGTLDCDRICKYVSGPSFIIESDNGEDIALIDNKTWVEDRLKQFEQIEPDLTILNKNHKFYTPFEKGSKEFQKDRPTGIGPFEIMRDETDYRKNWYIGIRKGYYKIIEDSSDLKTKARNYRRFIAYLDHISNVNSYKIKDNGNTFTLCLKNQLPLYEDALVRRVTWPVRSFEDTSRFVGPIELKPFILKILNSLGMVA